MFYDNVDSVCDFFLLLAFGIPIAFVLVISTVGYAFIIGDISWALISQRMIYGINIFVMISLPFFILAGNIMASGGITSGWSPAHNPS